MKKNNWLWGFFVILIVLSITGAVVVAKKVNGTDETESLKAKLRDEMNYLDGKITTMINDLNNIVLSNYIVEEKEIRSQNGTSLSDDAASSKSDSSSDGGSEQSSTKEEEKSSTTSGGSGSEKSKQPKTTTEMSYNSILTNDRDKIDWEQLKITAENLQSSWTTILLDLYKVDTNKDEILKFSGLLDELVKNVKEEKKVESLDTLTQMYSCVVSYITSFAQDESYQNIARTKENVFYAYVQVDKDNWQEVQKSLQNSENSYLTLVNNMQNNKKEFTINKAYIALKELQNSIPEQSKDVFYIKYKNLLEELNFLMG